MQCIAVVWCDTLFLTSAGPHTWCTVYRGEIQHYSTTLAQTLNSAPYTTYNTTPVRAHITTNSLTTPSVQTNSFLCLQDFDNSAAETVTRERASILECQEAIEIWPSHPNILYIVVIAQIQRHGWFWNVYMHIGYFSFVLRCLESTQWPKGLRFKSQRWRSRVLASSWLLIYFEHNKGTPSSLLTRTCQCSRQWSVNPGEAL